MGNKVSNTNINELMNMDKDISGDLNIYVYGNINTFLNWEDGFNFTASRNYYVLEQIFDKINKTNNGNIELNDGCGMYYQYESRKKEKDKKIYNPFCF